MRFIGRYFLKVDEKGRFALPGELKATLGDAVWKPFFITTGVSWLDLYTKEDWELFLLKNDSLPSMDPKVQQFQTLYVYAAKEVGFDKAYRFLIPQRMRQEAGLGNDIVMQGLGDKIRIFSEQAWKEWNEEAKASYVYTTTQYADKFK